MAHAAGPFDPILSELHHVIARRRVRTIMRATLACALATLIAWLALLIAERLGLGRLDPAPILAAVVLATAVSAAIIAHLQRRTDIEEAFYIDRATGFDEAYGTAVELARAREVSGPVPTQLMRSVGARLERISASRLVRILTPGFVAALALALSLAAAAGWLSQIPAPVQPERAGAPAALAEPADAETLATIAEMLAEDAQERDDPLLEAISRTLAERAATARSEPMSQELQRQINDLLDQAASAYGEDAPRWLGTAEGMRLNELEDALAAMEAAQAAQSAAGPAAPLEPVQPRGDEILDSPDGPGLYEVRPELAGRYSGRDSDEIASSADVVSRGQGAQDLAGGASEGPQLMQPQQLQSIGSMPVGAALESGRGASNAAGLGQEDLRADDAFIGLGAEPSREMIVSADPQAQGSRIRIEIIPEASQGGVAGAANAIDGQTGSGSTEPVARDFVPATARDIAARYFERIAQ